MPRPRIHFALSLVSDVKHSYIEYLFGQKFNEWHWSGLLIKKVTSARTFLVHGTKLLYFIYLGKKEHILVLSTSLGITACQGRPVSHRTSCRHDSCCFSRSSSKNGTDILTWGDHRSWISRGYTPAWADIATPARWRSHSFGIRSCRAQDCAVLCCGFWASLHSPKNFEDQIKWNTTRPADKTQR